MGRGHSNEINRALNLGESADNRYSCNDNRLISRGIRSSCTSLAKPWPDSTSVEVPLDKRDLGPPLYDFRVVNSCCAHWRLTKGVWILRQNKQQKASSGYAKKAAATTQLQLQIETSSSTAYARECPAYRGDILYLLAISKPA